MEDIRIQFVYDYVDPGSYLAFELLERWRSERDDAPPVEWSPLELRPPSKPPLDPDDPEWRSMSEFLEGEAEREGMPLRRPSSIPRTRKAHELALHAREQGCFDPIHAAIFRAHFVEGRDIGRVDVLVEIAEEGELDPAEAKTVLGVDRFLPTVEEVREALLESGVRGVPTVEARGRVLEGLSDVRSFREFLRELEGTL